MFRAVQQLRKGMIAGAIFLASVSAAQQQQQQDIPDAPSAAQPPQNFPKAEPNPRPGTMPSNPPPESAPVPESQPQPRSDSAPPAPANTANTPTANASPGASTANEQLYTLTRNVNQVLVPVMVKDTSGRLVSGLLPRDFAVYEDGKKQTLNIFTTDPFALSAAVIFDLGMPDTAVQKVIQTLPALEGAFSQFDEVSVYTYSSSVSKLTDFAAVGRRLEAALNEMKTVRGRNNGPPVTSGPMGPQGATVNGVPIDPSSTSTGWATGGQVEYHVVSTDSDPAVPIGGLTDGGVYRVVRTGTSSVIQLKYNDVVTSLVDFVRSGSGDQVIRRDGGNWSDNGFGANQHVILAQAPVLRPAQLGDQLQPPAPPGVVHGQAEAAGDDPV